MDDTWRTESLGRWCAKFTGVTSDSLGFGGGLVSPHACIGPARLDLTRDERFKGYPALSGIKLVLGVDYVALYRMPNQPTIIELHFLRRKPIARASSESLDEPPPAAE